MFVGRGFYRDNVSPSLFRNTDIFAADISAIPLPDDSVDVVTTTHALEPNHGRAKEPLSELLWVSRQRLILFEPSYELSADEQREHVEHRGYMRLVDPVSNMKLLRDDSCDFPVSRGVAYPVIRGIPVLRKSAQALATALGTVIGG